MKKPLILAGVLMVAAVQAAIEPACLFSDHLVLQRGKPVPVWGKATVGNEIKVRFAGETVKTEVGEDGKWRVDLPAMEACAEGSELVIAEYEPGFFGAKVDEKTFADVVVGEVWLCGGQSNMTFPIWPVNSIGSHSSREQNGYYDLKLTDEPQIRGVHMPNCWSPIETNHSQLAWFRFIPQESEYDFSATAWHYALRLHQALKIPIGVIECAWGGSCIETWIPASAWAETKNFAQKATTPIRTVMDEGQKKRLAADPKYKPNFHQQARACWNAMVYPLAPYAVKGMIWYQGCSNRLRWQSYYEMLTALRTGWGRAFECGEDMPFFLCQIAPFDYSCVNQNYVDKGESEIREEMERFALDNGANVGCVSLSDAGEMDCIHPGDKRTVGTRLAAMALNRIYGRTDLKCDAPRLKSAKLVADKVQLEFTNCTGWNRKHDEQSSFELADADGVYFNPLKIDYCTNKPFIWLQIPTNKNPTKVTYMRKFTMHGYIKNEVGLPIGPFRAKIEK